MDNLEMIEDAGLGEEQVGEIGQGTVEEQAPQETLSENQNQIPYSLEEVEEWRLGNMRMADYTRKTQELAAQRNQMQEAQKLYDFLQENPHLVDVMAEAYQNGGGNGQTPALTTQVQQQLEMVHQQLANIELDKEILGLKNKYPDFDEEKVIKFAANNGLTNLDIAYKALKADMVTKDSVKEQVLKELQENNEATRALIGNYGNDGATSNGLTSQEKAYAKKLDMTEEEYLKWKV